MGLENRDYMDTEPQRGALPRVRTATAWVILANVAVFVLWQLALRRPAFDEFMATHFTVSYSGVFEHGRVHTLLTYAISQRDPLHILFNMLFLYFFGRELESLYGRREYLAFLTTSALVAGVAHTLLSPNDPALGASGAVMAVVVVYALFFPNRQIFFMGLFPMAVKWMALIYVGLDLLGVFQGGSGVAHFAHLGGALTGLVWHRMNIRVFPSHGFGGAGRIGGWFKRRRRRPPATEREPERLIDPATEQRVDALLEKIARDGIGALSDEERKFLKKASTRYRA